MESKIQNTDRNNLKVSFLPLKILVAISSYFALFLLFPVFVAVLGGFSSTLNPDVRNSYRIGAILMLILYFFYFGHLASLILKKINYWFWAASSITFASYLFGIITYHIHRKETDFLLNNIFPLIILLFPFVISLYYFYIGFKFRKNLK
jgi:hypothetical protein